MGECVYKSFQTSLFKQQKEQQHNTTCNSTTEEERERRDEEVCSGSAMHIASVGVAGGNV